MTDRSATKSRRITTRDRDTARDRLAAHHRVATRHRITTRHRDAARLGASTVAKDPAGSDLARLLDEAITALPEGLAL
ncbi:MAG TPA: hypothetical protein VGG05_02185 [Pseudonocardiaceae bacterium]